MTVKLSISDVELEDVIGEGNFCVVHSGKLKATDAKVAIKVYSKAQIDRMKKRADVLMEKHALRKLHHPNILSLVDTFTDELNAYVVTELCLGELWQLCKRWGEPERRAQCFLYQILEALEFVHASGIAHRDVKAENVFITSTGRAKLGDFGTCRDFSDPSLPYSITPSFKKNFQHYVGTPQFMAPEAMDNVANDQISDLWSFGCLIYQTLLGIPPFHAASEYFVMLRVKAADLAFPENPITCGISEAAQDCVKKFVTLDRDSRLSLDAARNHPFFAPPQHALCDYTASEEFIKAEAQRRPFPEDAKQALQDAPQECGGAGAEEARQRILWTRSWEWRCRMGAGSAAVDHLTLD
jgi:serine/threonine protein kinase